jgi:hypothetical protein
MPMVITSINKAISVFAVPETPLKRIFEKENSSKAVMITYNTGKVSLMSETSLV